MTRLLTVIVPLALTLVACATALQTEPIPSELQNASLQYCVASHGGDQRGIDRRIASEILSHGIDSKNGPASTRPASCDVLVVYEDEWKWDMSEYLIFLRIDLRDPETNVLLATGSSYQSSLARKSEGEVVANILEGMFGRP